ncbi:hypothetical protein SKAU_G00121940 [Synaphobranchus kaupii]|uniref:Uncharacterized protein n=1 Tax=Synaphobranchus kaupii TaxID=118154 RepID=A0A9Q1J2H5_SYNKA|nr:hypothetical protein SKAU_G00121940 [Synaphobranchus kaupii]
MKALGFMNGATAVRWERETALHVYQRGAPGQGPKMNQAIPSTTGTSQTATCLPGQEREVKPGYYSGREDGTDSRTKQRSDRQGGGSDDRIQMPNAAH